MSRRKLIGLSQMELCGAVTELGMPAFRGKQIAKWLYQKGVNDIDDMTDLSLNDRERIKAEYSVGLKPAETQQESKDGTVKFLFQVADNQYVETVYIPESDRATLCVSCQVGCKMNCLFCQTAKQGFEGQLSETDKMNQIYSTQNWALTTGHNPLTNIVFMGQGEPMDNLDNVLKATELIQAPYGWAWSAKRITVSSVGVKNKLKRYLDESNCHLAISLHSPLPDQRAQMMPAEKALSINELIPLLKQYDFSHQRRLTFEYICFGHLNDSQTHAKELVKILRGVECRVNLLRFHKIPGVQLPGSDEKRMEEFKNYLNSRGLTATIRASRGEDIDAACGMLISKNKQL